MLASRGETYRLKAYSRKEDSPYEWESYPYAEFFGRPAGQNEKRTYRIQQGINSNSDSVFVYCSNLPDEVKPQDKVEFLGKEWTVESIGYYLQDAWVVNAGAMSEEYVQRRCPKGLALR